MFKILFLEFYYNLSDVETIPGNEEENEILPHSCPKKSSCRQKTQETSAFFRTL